MLTEDLEFQISQYADGTLPAEQVAALEARLAAEAEARALLDEYRRVDALLQNVGRDVMPVPSVRWEALAEHLSEQVAEAAGAYRVLHMPWTRVAGLAVAACVLLATGLGIRTYLHSTGKTGLTNVTVNKPIIPVQVGPQVTPQPKSEIFVQVNIPDENTATRSPTAVPAPVAAAIAIEIGPGNGGGMDRSRDVDLAVSNPRGALIATGANPRREGAWLPF